ncbi:MAG: hypothetical protein ACE5I7_16135, partial [Candidatus Binatia bacterium]
MSDPVYPACIRELYESEIFGEAFALALIKVAGNARDQYHFGTLLQLETETKARLRPFLSKYNVSLAEDMELSGIADAVAAYQASSFPEFAAAMKPTVQGFLARFQEIERVGPVEDQKILHSMIRHESAILRWLQMESEGNS